MVSSLKIWFLASGMLALTGCGARPKPAPAPPGVVPAPVASGQAAADTRPAAIREAIRAKGMLPPAAVPPARQAALRHAAAVKRTAARVPSPRQAAVFPSYRNASPALWSSDFAHQRALFVQQLRQQQARPRQNGDLFYSVDAAGTIYHLEPGGPRRISDAELKHPSTARP